FLLKTDKKISRPLLKFFLSHSHTLFVVRKNTFKHTLTQKKDTLFRIEYLLILIAVTLMVTAYSFRTFFYSKKRKKEQK
ncbi:hypothetical protein, partial [Turicibacter sp.]|uniref:hypothetical protein n=1 Tax=Turicibacter sp. TaxID=2049042 RepID=UPI001B67676F